MNKRRQKTGKIRLNDGAAAVAGIKAGLKETGDYEHTDPDGISCDTRTVLKNDGVIEAEGSPKELEGSNEYYKLFSKTL